MARNQLIDMATASLSDLMKEHPGETVTAAMFQTIQNAAQEQKLHTVDDVTALATEQTGKVIPLDEETSEQFQQLMKLIIEQAGK